MNVFTPLLLGTPVKVLISSSRISEISTEGIFLDLLLHEEIVSRNALSHCGNLLAGVIIVPSEPFHYQLRVYDSKGNSLTETREIILKPAAEMCTPPIPTTAIPTTPTASPPSGFPCLNDGRCVTFVRFGRTLIVCSCPEGYSGSQCQTSNYKFIYT